MSARDLDVVVVGAGPAGSAAALELRRQGYSVAVLEKSRFPRHKICGDFLTPGCVARLREIDAAVIETESPCRLRGMRLTFEGREILSDFPGGKTGWSLSRFTLDALMARQAHSAGVELFEQTRAVRLERDPDGRHRVEGCFPDGTPQVWHARLVVEAGGRHGLIARRLGWRQDDGKLERYALWSYMERVRGLSQRGEMHLLDGGYVGVAPLGPPGMANVTMVLTPASMRRARGDPGAFLIDALKRHPELGPRSIEARPVAPIRGMGPLACRARKLAGDGVALVGDAGGFVDPFTGEGVYLALTSAKLLSDSVRRHGLDGERALAAYERSWRASFASKLRLCRILQAAIARPWLARHLARALASRKELADRMVGVTGDLLPPSHVLSPGYLGRLLLAGMMGG